MDEYYNGNGIWIPAEILHNKELTSTEKILYAEIYYLDRPDIHCTASNEHLSEFLDMSESGVKKCLAHLKELGYIRSISFDGRKRSIAVNVKWASYSSDEQVDTPVSSRNTQECLAEGYKNEFLLCNRENRIENSREKGSEPEARRSISKNHSKIYKETESLEDRLSSGEEIDKQKREKKKSPAEKEREKCLDMIEKSEYSDETKSLLVNYYEWASSGTDKRRIKDSKLWAKKLDALSQFVAKGADVNETIKNSIEHKYYMFVIPEKDTRSNKGVPDDGVIGQTLHGKEVEEELARRKELYGVF